MNAKKATTLLLLLQLGCMTKKIHRNPVDLGSESHQAAFVPRGFYLVENKNEDVDPNTLFITQISVARTKGPTRFIPHISFGAVGRGEYVKWNACPDYSPDAWKEATPDCHSGQTLDPMLEITDLEPGPWLISLQYCLSSKDKKTVGRLIVYLGYRPVLLILHLIQNIAKSLKRKLR